MSSFANQNFAHRLYAAFRPSYSHELYDTVLRYHGKGSRSLALDLGTGHGTVARNLALSFTQVIGSDVSAGMIAEARRLSGDIANIAFRESQAESNSFVPDRQCDLVTAAECVHWFDYARFWPEMARILRPGGTLAIWGYHRHVLVDYPTATGVLDRFNASMDETSFGPYWPEPGHSILTNSLRDVVPPPADWEDIRRIEYEPLSSTSTSSQRPSSNFNSDPDPDSDSRRGGDRFMASTMTIGSMAEYMRTWSAYHEWQKRWPDRKRRGRVGRDGTGDDDVDGTAQGDVIDELVDEMRRADLGLAERARETGILNVEVAIEFQSALILARRR